MPSIYSIGFGLAGCKVTLVNGIEDSLRAWKRLGIADRAEIRNCCDLANTSLRDNSYDLVWNFASFSTFKNHSDMLKEMIRLSKKYIVLCSVNSYNPGYFSHRFAHYITKVPWSHGDVIFYSPRKTRNYLRQHGLNIIKVGVLDSVPWPDSIGFRDIRLHRMQKDMSEMNWHSRYVDYLCENRMPSWIRAVNLFESIPMPLLIKFIYSHLFYVLAEKREH